LTIDDDLVVINSIKPTKLMLPLLESTKVLPNDLTKTKKIVVRFLTGTGHQVVPQGTNKLNFNSGIFHQAHNINNVTFCSLGSTWIAL